MQARYKRADFFLGVKTPVYDANVRMILTSNRSFIIFVQGAYTVGSTLFLDQPKPLRIKMGECLSNDSSVSTFVKKR